MALTAAERQKRRREKLKKEGKYEDLKKKNKAEAQKSREKKKNNFAKLSKTQQAKVKRETKENVRRRVAKCRELKRKVSSCDFISPFKSNSTLGKAVTRAKRSMPTSPRKKRAVIKRLFQTELSQADNPSSSSHTEDLRRLSLGTLDLVKKFYMQDDISRQAPGRKDVVTVRDEDGTKSKIQTRHLQFSIKEAHSLFKEQYPDIKCAKSKFAELRPRNVLLSSRLPHNVCLCKYHENFIMALESLHNQISNVPKYSQNLPSTLVCKINSEDCWINKCDACKDGKVFMKLYADHIEMHEFNTITWCVWKKVEERMCKVLEEGTVRCLLEYICNLIPEFLDHCNIKRIQASLYKEEHRAVTSTLYPQKMALLQVDFAENYKCTSQDEIQSAHWAQSQVSLFTAALYHSGVIHPLIIATDDLSHSKETVIPFMDRILEEVPLEIQVIHIWSDGPSSQFKNKYIAGALAVLQDKCRKQITWNFFATSHGKGPVDGIGGSVKRQVWESVRKRRSTVYNASDFVAAAAASNVNVFEMSPADIKLRYKNLDLDNIFSNVQAVPGIKKNHFLEVINGATIRSKLSKQSFSKDQLTESSTSVGDWVLVEYDGELYPGEVKASEYLVSVMIQAGNYWKWPINEDKVFYPKEKLKRKLNSPDVANARGHFKFFELL